MQTIGQRLRLIRERRKLLQKDFADLFGFSLSKYQRIEKGKVAPDVDILLKILDEYPDEDLSWLLTGDGNYNRKTSPPSGVDGPLFAQVIQAVDAQLEKYNIVLDQVPKAEMTSLLYEHSALLKRVGEKGVDEKLVERYIGLVGYPRNFSTDDH
ncbi:MAG: helix-turn-helix domain-containing protein [Desulfobacterales bacterium]|nr:helix-turn-helix domain-containing protein [Desulfobacterales bacterium]